MIDKILQNIYIWVLALLFASVLTLFAAAVIIGGLIMAGALPDGFWGFMLK